MDHQAEVQHWLEDYLGALAKHIDAADVLGSLRFTGDDATELLAAFAARFDVDMSGFDAWQHFDADEPPMHRRFRPHSADGRALSDLPISVADFAQGAEMGCWALRYDGRTIRYHPPRGFGLVLTAIALACCIALIAFNRLQ